MVTNLSLKSRQFGDFVKTTWLLCLLHSNLSSRVQTHSRQLQHYHLVSQVDFLHKSDKTTQLISNL